MNQDIDPEVLEALRKMFPRYAEEELYKAYETFRSYFEVVFRVWLQVISDPQETARFEELKRRKGI